MTQPKRSGFKIFVMIVLLIIIILSITIALYLLWIKPNTNFSLIGKNETNETQQGKILQIDQEIKQTTVDNRGNTTVWDSVIVFLIGFFVIIIVAILIWAVIKIFTSRRALTAKGKSHCEKAGYDELVKKGYPVPETPEGKKYAQPFTTIRWYGGGEQRNKSWALLWLKKGQSLEEYDFNTKSLKKFVIISILVDALTLDTWNERTGFASVDMLNYLRNVRLGKDGSIPHHPVGTEHESSLEEIFAAHPDSRIEIGGLKK